MYGHRGETPWIVIAALPGNFNRVARHVLSLLLENACDVTSGAGAERDEEQLNRRSSCRSLAVGVERQRMTGGSDAEK